MFYGYKIIASHRHRRDTEKGSGNYAETRREILKHEKLLFAVELSQKSSGFIYFSRRSRGQSISVLTMIW